MVTSGPDRGRIATLQDVLRKHNVAIRGRHIVSSPILESLGSASFTDSDLV